MSKRLTEEEVKAFAAIVRDTSHLSGLAIKALEGLLLDRESWKEEAERLRKALEPFARAAQTSKTPGSLLVSWEDCEAAAAALTPP